MSDLRFFRDPFLFERIQFSDLLDLAELLHQSPAPPTGQELLIESCSTLP